MSDTSPGPSLDDVVSLAKRRGLVFPTSEIYGGLAGFYDYGPYGAQMVKNIRDAWWDAFVRTVPNIYGIDTAIIQNPKLWEASGHVAGFNDPLVDCKNCKSRHRADRIAGEDSTNLSRLEELIADKACPVCGKKGQFTKPRQFNMMMKTFLGPSEDSESTAYLRPETAGGMFASFELVRETGRAKIPFGIGQIGKAFRNEISPRDFIFRVRELEQMEMQYFVDPANEDAEYENLRTYNWTFLSDVMKFNEKNLQWHEHTPDERAHYANAAHDIQFRFPFGFKELWGTHNRTDFDLKAHMEASGKDLRYFDVDKQQHYIPYVMESSVGVGRLFLAALTDAYTVEAVNDTQRVVLKLAHGIAPVDVAILPLSKKEELAKPAQELYHHLVANTDLTIEYDDTQSIGKRYRRQDEIGTPKCITVDFESINDKAVTIRDRDSMEQKRVPMDHVKEALSGD